MVLEVRGVEKSYGQVRALRGVDLSVAPGEIVGLLGPNGAGKTTLVSIVAGLRRPDAGSVTVNDVDVLKKPKEAVRHIGFAPQDLGIYPILTVRDNLKVFGELAGLSKEALAERMDWVGEILDIGRFFDRLGRELSGGERRRVHTAIALLHRPPLLLLDEPTTGVDVRTRAEVLAAVRELAREGAAICYSTHYLTEVEQLGASVALIDEGRMIARGRVEELVADHGTSGVELVFDGEAPELDLDGTIDRDGETLRVLVPEPARAMPGILARLGAETRRLRSVDLLRPSLDSAFFALTGRRYESGDEEHDPEEDRDVAHA